MSSKHQERSAIVHGSSGIGKAGVDTKALPFWAEVGIPLIPEGRRWKALLRYSKLRRYKVPLPRSGNNAFLSGRTMPQRLSYAAVPDGARKVIHVVRVNDDILSMPEADEIAAKMRERMLSKHGEQAADVVVVLGHSKETLRLVGDSYAVTRVRTAMFNAAIRWQPIELD